MQVKLFTLVLSGGLGPSGPSCKLFLGCLCASSISAENPKDAILKLFFGLAKGRVDDFLSLAVFPALNTRVGWAEGKSYRI